MGRPGCSSIIASVEGKPGAETRGGILWEPNVPFEATLTLGRAERVTVWARDTGGRSHPVHIDDMIKILSTADMTAGKITGRWVYEKSGTNYWLVSA